MVDMSPLVSRSHYDFLWVLMCDSSCGAGHPERRMGFAGDWCASLPDGRSGHDGRYPMRGTGPPAFPRFFMRVLFLHRRTLSAERGIPNARTPFGMGRIPCGNRIRLMPEGVPPERFDGVFPAIVADPGRSGAPSGTRCSDGRVLAASDGPGISGPASCTAGETGNGAKGGLAMAAGAIRWGRSTIAAATCGGGAR